MAAGVSPLAIVLAAVLEFAIGLVWYSRKFLGRPWMTALGLAPDRDPVARRAMLQIVRIRQIATLLAAYVLAHVVHYLEAHTPATGAATGFLLWSGVMVIYLRDIFVVHRWPLLVHLINSGYHLAGDSWPWGRSWRCGVSAATVREHRRHSRG